MENCVLFVGNLPFGATSDSLEEVFEALPGYQRLEWVNDSITGEFKGFVFVHFENESAAAAAQTVLAGFEIGGRNIKCEFRENARG